MQRTFILICEAERDDLRSAIDLTEQLVEHGYVDMARVRDDADPLNPTLDENGQVISASRLETIGAIMSDPDVKTALAHYTEALSNWKRHQTLSYATIRDSHRRKLYATIGRALVSGAYDDGSRG